MKESREPRKGGLRVRGAALALGLALATALGVSAPAANAQQDCSLPTPWPDGCTLSSNFPLWAQLGLDDIFLGACSNHDLCYGTCGASRAGCDANFLVDMEAACAFWATQVAFPFGGLQTGQDFVTYCNGVVAPTMYGVLVVVGGSAFDKDQCVRCCDLAACSRQNCIVPAACTPPPPPPPPPPDPCLYVDCSCGCDDYCCGWCFEWEDCYFSRWSPRAKPHISTPGPAHRAAPNTQAFLRSLGDAHAQAAAPACSPVTPKVAGVRPPAHP